MPFPPEDSDRDSPEFLSLDPGPRQISQTELRMLRTMEQAYAEHRALVQRKLREGATIQVGELEPNPGGFVYPSMPLVRKAQPKRKRIAATLSASELEMLADFYRNGTFEPAQLRVIIDRFEREGYYTFRLQRERMMVVGCWDVSKHLARRVSFRYHISRVRLLVHMHRLGIFNAAGCIIHELYTLNREYFHGPHHALGA